jgi:alpha-tubulin suppressor-like RCC1 family protein
LSNVVAIAAGGAWYAAAWYGHSLALTAEGRVVAWGAKGSGQTSVPSGLSNVVAIAAGGYRSLALTAEGQVVAWGVDMTASMNPWGFLDYSPSPVTVPSGLSNVMAIAAGDSNNLALTAKGWVVAWGSNGASQMPSGLTNEVAIAAGGDHFLALSSLPPGVAAPAWAGPRFLAATVGHPFQHRIMVKNGADTFGSTGLPPGLALDPSTGLITGQPAQAGKYAVVLSATNRVGSCEWTVTLFVNGPAVPGIASSGLVQASLGIGFNYPVVASYEPVWYGARGLPPGLVMVPQTGVISGVPVETGDFVVSLLASNRYGLGTGSLTVRVSPVMAWGGWGHSYDNGPTNMPAGLINVVAISAVGDDNLALTAEGRVVGWDAIDVPSGSSVVAIAAGYSHGLALTAEGRVVAWGHYFSDLTVSTFVWMTVPVGLSNVVAIAAGGVWPDGGHSLALTAEGRVVGWGRSDEGQATVPIGLSNVVAIAAGGYHSLALTAEGRVVGWGSYMSGPNFVPVTVPTGLGNVVAIAAEGDSSLALTADGRVVAWGHTWAAPGGLSNVVAIAAGEYHSMALTAAGRVVDWGVYYNGTDYVSMTVVSESSNVVAIAAGRYHSLALLRQPTVPTPRLVLFRGLSGLELQAQGAPGISCQLLRASRLPGPWLPAEPVTFTSSVQQLRPPDVSQRAQFFRLLRK